jgi:hypothetical protein
MTDYSDTEDPSPPNQRATEDSEQGQGDDQEKDTIMDEQGRDEEAAEVQENTTQDSDGWATGRQTTVDDVLANRRLYAVPDVMTREEDKMDYETTLDQSEQVRDQSEKVQEKAAATPYNNQYQDFEYGPSQYEHAQIRAKNLQYFISNQRTMRQITDGGVMQGGPSSNVLLLTDGTPPDHDVIELQQNYPPQQLTIYETSTGLTGEAVTCVTQSTTIELTQVTQGEEEKELKSGNEQPIGTIASLPEHISDRGDSNEGPVDIALRTVPDTRSQVAAG